jgi:K+-transporting ATPase ATPase C chain
MDIPVGVEKVNMKKNIVISILYTVVTTILLGIGYPLLMTALGQVMMKDKANGSLIVHDGKIVGSSLLAQPFTGPGYFHPRPSAAGANGYDATSSGGTNYGPTNQKLVDRVQGGVTTLQSDNPNRPVPIDAVTTSGSGLDPHITLANAEFQVARVAKARGISESEISRLVNETLEPRQIGILGEQRVNVLALNIALDRLYTTKSK